jgi:hypothetical protein
VAGNDIFHDLVKLRGRKCQAFVPFGLAVKGQVDGDQSTVRIERFADKGKGIG